ncbi:MAG: hypothetical protein ACYC9Z_14450 [Casimicrobiaceae bacterium]
MKNRAVGTSLALLALVASSGASGEATEIRFAKQTSMGYVQFNIIDHHKLTISLPPPLERLRWP